MPELPEVETVRRGLEPAMEGARFTKVEVHRGDLRWPEEENHVEYTDWDLLFCNCSPGWVWLLNR